MRSTRVSLIAGDGIGPEISRATKRVIDSSSGSIDWEVIKTDPREEAGEEIVSRMVDSVQETGVGLKGPITTPVGSGYDSLTVAMRKELGLYANVRPVKPLPNLGRDLQGGEVDLVTVRENTEGLYSGIEHVIGDDYAESIKLTTREGSERIAKFAFEYALKEGREKVTAVHKANVLKKTDGMFLKIAEETSEDYPGVDFEDKIVDNMALQLFQRPEDYEVLLAPNLYGDILSDLSAGLIGGLGVAPGGNYGEDTVVFEAVHGSAPDIAGQDVANPLGLIRSGIMMLEQVGQEEAASNIDSAIEDVLSRGEVLTPDLGGSSSTCEIAEAIIRRL